MSKYIDLTHFIAGDMPYYPGTPPPEITPLCTVEEIGFAEMNLKIYSHTGTHIDAPAHMFNGGKTLDMYDIDYFIGEALMISAEGRRVFDPDYVISSVESLARVPDFVILHTGWDKLWSDPGYYEGFPVLSLEAAEYIASKGIRGVGVDAISVDRVEDEKLPVHQIFFEKEMIIVENLTNLDKIGVKSFQISAIPIKVKDSDGSPARVFAKVL